MLNLSKEKEVLSKGYKIIGSIDEAGRGPLAGPVVAACVTVSVSTDFLNNPEVKELELIKDSKKLTPKKRQELFKVIHEHFDEVAIGVCDAKTIDCVNILQATFLAMKKAIGALKNKCDYVLVDGRMVIPNLTTAQEAIIAGDKHVFSISAASIIAKVARDHVMQKYDRQYPDYGFAKHKGYGTKLHMEKLKEFGPTAIHRKTFAPIRDML